MGKDTQISIRLEPELVARFERIVQKLGGAASRAALVRMAMLAGLPEVEERYSSLPDEVGRVGRAASRKKH